MSTGFVSSFDNKLRRYFGVITRRCVSCCSIGLGALLTLCLSSTLSFAGDVLDRLSEDLVISIDDLGPRPTNIEMKIRQGIIFLYNATNDSLLTLELDFGKHAMTCFSSSTDNLAFREGGVLASTRPIGPGGFGTTCFPTVGTYPYTIYGLERFPSGLKGIIEVTW